MVVIFAQKIFKKDMMSYNRFITKLFVEWSYRRRASEKGVYLNPFIVGNISMEIVLICQVCLW